jgi:hypothetical protein
MWVPDRMIGFYLAAAHITTCLNYRHSYSAIAIPHIQRSLFTLMHPESISQQSSSLTAYSWNTQCNCRHSQLALYNYTLAFALLHTILARSITLTGIACNSHTDTILVTPLRSLKYTRWLAHCHWLLTDTLGVLRTLTGYWLVSD